jgi:hypothetical protein
MTLRTAFEPCGAPLRGKPGRTCQAPALRGHTRCRLHAGRPRGSVTPEGLAATKAGHGLFYARYRAAKARGEPVTLLGGRKKRWPIPRPWRFQLSPEDEARVVAAMVLHDKRTRIVRPRWEANTSARLEARSLESFERTFIMRLNDRDHPLSPGEVDATYQNIREYEAAVGSPGSDARLERLLWEVEQYKRRHAAVDALATARKAQASAGESNPVESPPSRASTEPLPAPFAAPDDPPMDPVDTSYVGLSPPPPSPPPWPPEMSADEWQRAAERTEAMIGHFRRSAEARAEQLADDWRPHSIAPRLSQKR